MGTHRSGRGAEGGGLTLTSARPRTFHGRRHGKALKPAQVRRLAELLPRLTIAGVRLADNAARAPLVTAALFGDDRPLWLEIGYGGGEHLVRQAQAHPEAGLIGCEPFVNGTAKALGAIEAADVANVRLHPGDARDLIEILPAGSLARVFLLYPDPWPKPRHRGRRFMCAENLEPLARAMAPGAELRLATDIADYAAHARAAVTAQGGLAEAARPDPEAPWSGWQPTRYELKALCAGRRPQYLSFVRRPATDVAPVDPAAASA